MKKGFITYDVTIQHISYDREGPFIEAKITKEATGYKEEEYKVYRPGDRMIFRAKANPYAYIDLGED